MRSYKTEGLSSLPTVTLDAEQGVFEMSGKCIPENTADFFMPIVEWLEEYAHSPNPQTIFTFRMEYFNTSTSKYIVEIGRVLEKIQAQGNSLVKIIWYHEDGDSDIQEAGLDFKKLLSIPIEVTPIMIENAKQELIKEVKEIVKEPTITLTETHTTQESDLIRKKDKEISVLNSVSDRLQQKLNAANTEIIEKNEEIKKMQQKIHLKIENIQKQQEKIVQHKIQQKVAQIMIGWLIIAFLLKEIIIEIINHDTPFTLTWYHRVGIAMAFLLPLFFIKIIAEKRYRKQFDAEL